ncbi:MAG: hypothetical protein OQJ84_02495 [Xanthomonadales bacterium]|nr:hypothetical protein [Xanthomonadales bacterium]
MLMLCVLVQLIPPACCLAESAPAVPSAFDFSHLTLAIDYFENPSESLLIEIAGTPAAAHLKRHSDRTGYYPPSTTARDITSDLLAEIPSHAVLQKVKALYLFARERPARQRSCLARAAAYLPIGAQPKNPLHITWGYDIGVAMDDHASLNFSHGHFLDQPDEIWFYCIHEAHHSGVMQIHPMPLISDIDSVRELYDFVRYATFLEGLAVHAARSSRREAGALGRDRDYVALEDHEVRNRILSDYWCHLSALREASDLPLNDEHWKVVDQMSSGERLWYVAGAAMANLIERELGRTGLLESIEQGPEAFFNTYQEIWTGISTP